MIAAYFGHLDSISHVSVLQNCLGLKTRASILTVGSNMPVSRYLGHLDILYRLKPAADSSAARPLRQWGADEGLDASSCRLEGAARGATRGAQASGSRAPPAPSTVHTLDPDNQSFKIHMDPAGPETVVNLAFEAGRQAAIIHAAPVTDISC